MKLLVAFILMTVLSTNAMAWGDQRSISSNTIHYGVLTQTEIDALTPSKGDTVFNDDDSVLQFYNGSAWISAAASITLEDSISNGSMNGATQNAIYDALSLKVNSADLASVATSGVASDVASTPAGNLSSTNVQAAL